MNARRELADEAEPEASPGAGAGNLGLTVPPKTSAKRRCDCLDLREAMHGAMATRYVFAALPDGDGSEKRAVRSCALHGSDSEA